MFILLISCQSTTRPKDEISQNTEKKTSTQEISVLKTEVSFPLSVGYLNNNDSDSMFLNLDNERLIITPYGKVLKSGNIYFDIKSEDEIKSLFILPKNSDFIVFYVSSDGDGGYSYAKKIIPAQNQIIWETSIFAFNLASPAIVGDYAYLSTFGFVGKLDLRNGKFVWKFEDLNKKYTSFSPPQFLKDSIVLFMRKPYIDSILIDDLNCKILSISK